MPDPRIWPVENVTDTFVFVGVLSTLVLAANGHRADTDFTNDGDAVIYLARGNAAVIGSGIRLNPNGGTYHIGTNNLFHGEIYGISADEQQEGTYLAISEGNRP